MKKKFTYGTHTPALALCLHWQHPSNLVIEFGSGPTSTPLINLFAQNQGFEVISYESDDAYYAYAQEFTGLYHTVQKVCPDSLESTIQEVIDLKPDFVFLDNGWMVHEVNGSMEKFIPRNQILQRIIDTVPLILCHDTEDGPDAPYYKWDFSKAKYQKHFEDFGVRTSLLSNTIEVNKIKYISPKVPS